jgi:hypothetical protein
MKMTMKTKLASLEQEVRHGPGVGIGDHGARPGPAGYRLAEQLGTAGASPDLVNLLGTIKELQDALRNAEAARASTERQLADLNELVRSDTHAHSNAERALSRLVRGQCCSQSARENYSTDHVRMHREMKAGYHVGHLASQLATRRATMQDALEAIAELCETIDKLHHRVDRAVEQWGVLVSNRAAMTRALDDASRVGPAVVRFCPGTHEYIGAPVPGTNETLFFGVRTGRDRDWTGKLTWCHWIIVDDVPWMMMFPDADDLRVFGPLRRAIAVGGASIRVERSNRRHRRCFSRCEVTCRFARWQYCSAWSRRAPRAKQFFSNARRR